MHLTVPLATMGVTYFVGPIAMGSPAVPQDIKRNPIAIGPTKYVTHGRIQVDSIKTWPIAFGHAR